MDDANEELSKRLHDVLDVIGASEYNRKILWESAMINEIVRTFINKTFLTRFDKMSYYQVGSLSEGTTTLGLESDIDIIQCDDTFPVIDNLFVTKQRGFSYLMVTDADTKPGYFRLQIAYQKRPLTAELDFIIDDIFLIDRKGRVCANNCIQGVGPKVYRNGPAHTIPTNGRCSQIDNVYALRCRQIPRSANSWLHRIRKYDWPSQKQLTEMTSYGCFFVGVGHPLSNNQSIEWRISFTLQERDLMSSLNETQHKCYILLKMIKKDLIEPNAGESLSSYHCKTSLFYTIENSHSHFWTNVKLILCVQQCLKRLFIWVKAKNCPNYFIPEENMFDKLSVMTLEKIEYVLNDILKKDIKFLFSLTCDNVGDLLKSKLIADELVCSLLDVNFSKYVLCNLILDHIYCFRNMLIRHIDTTTHKGYMNGLTQLLLYLQNTNHVNEPTTRDVRLALDSIIPHIALQYKQSTYAQYLSQGNSSDLRTLTATNLIPEVSECDLISSRLSLASLYIQSEQYQEECKRILVSCEQEIEPFVINVCNCNIKRSYFNTVLNNILCFTDMSSEEFRHCTTGCMVFHPSQVSLVHVALQYEMFRNVYTQPGLEFEMERDYWLNWIAVDSQIYLYFLQYVLNSNEKDQTEKETAKLKLVYVLKTDHLIGHRETALNLLGWIFQQKNELQIAWTSLCLSWQERPFNNAAKWHMLILLSTMLSQTYGWYNWDY